MSSITTKLENLASGKVITGVTRVRLVLSQAVNIVPARLFGFQEHEVVRKYNAALGAPQRRQKGMCGYR